MRVFEGIPIDETRLFFDVIFSAVMAVIAIGMLLFCVIFVYRNRIQGISRKEKRRMEKLAACAETDERARKELERRRKKEIRHKKAVRSDWMEMGVMVAAVLVFCLACLLGYALPTWLDYFRKDYTIYTGKFVVTSHRFTRWVELDSGKDLQGADLLEGSYNGTVVYGKRSKIALATIDEKAE